MRSNSGNPSMPFSYGFQMWLDNCFARFMTKACFDWYASWIDRELGNVIANSSLLTEYHQVFRCTVVNPIRHRFHCRMNDKNTPYEQWLAFNGDRPIYSMLQNYVWLLFSLRLYAYRSALDFVFGNVK